MEGDTPLIYHSILFTPPHPSLLILTSPLLLQTGHPLYHSHSSYLFPPLLHHLIPVSFSPHPLPNTHLAALASSDQQSVGQCTCSQCPVQSGPENLPWTHPHHTAEHKAMYTASHILKITHIMALTWSRYFTVSTLPYSTASCKQDPLAPGSFRFTSKPCLTSSPMTSLWLCLAASNRALCGMSER